MIRIGFAGHTFSVLITKELDFYT